MNRNVKLSISGLHSDAGTEENKVEKRYNAEYFKRNDSHYLLYEEQQEGYDKSSQIRIKLKDNLMELTRQGAIQTHMVFEKNKKHITRYATPYGEIQLGIDTKDICMEESENDMRVRIEYVLAADGEYLSDCTIELRVEQKCDVL